MRKPEKMAAGDGLWSSDLQDFEAPDPDENGERRLWMAVLSLAIKELYLFDADNKDCPLDWFLSSNESPMSFLWVCELLGFDPKRFFRKHRPQLRLLRLQQLALKQEAL